MKCNDWLANNVKVSVVENGHRSIIERDLFPQLGLSIIYSKQVLNTNQNQSPIKKQIALDFPDLISRIGRSHNPIVKSKLHKYFTPIKEKGRLVPNNLQS